MRRNSKAIILRATTLAVSLVFVLGVAELGFRFLTASPWYERLPEEQQRTPRYEYSVGASKFTLRFPPLKLPKLKGSQRMLFLGDSFTYGSGVKESETFVSLVTSRLNDNSKVSRGSVYETFNGGVPASMTRDWVELFDEMAEEFQPDSVIVVFFLRDGVQGVTSIGQINAIRNRMVRLSEHSILYRFSRLWRYFIDREVQKELSAEYLGQLESGYLGEEGETIEWKSAQENLKYLQLESNRLGANFYLVIFPVLFDLGAEYPLDGVVDEILRFANQEQMTALSLLPAFRGLSAPDLWVSPLDQHPNGEGHAIAAEAIYDFLINVPAGEAGFSEGATLRK